MPLRQSHSASPVAVDKRAKYQWTAPRNQKLLEQKAPAKQLPTQPDFVFENDSCPDHASRALLHNRGCGDCFIGGPPPCEWWDDERNNYLERVAYLYAGRRPSINGQARIHDNVNQITIKQGFDAAFRRSDHGVAVVEADDRLSCADSGRITNRDISPKKKSVLADSKNYKQQNRHDERKLDKLRA